MESKVRKKKDGTEASRNRTVHPLPEWEERATRLLRVEMAKKKMNFKRLARCLEDLNIDETPPQVNRKVNRGKFSAAYLLACLEVLGVEEIRMADIRKLVSQPTGTGDADAEAGNL